MVERAALAWMQLWLNQAPDGTALHAPFGDVVSNPLATQFCLSAEFAIPFGLTLRYFSGAFQELCDGPGSLTSHYCSCTAAQMEFTLRITDGLVAEFAARKWVSFNLKPIVAALMSLRGSLMQLLCPSTIFGEVLEGRWHFNALSA